MFFYQIVDQGGKLFECEADEMLSNCKLLVGVVSFVDALPLPGRKNKKLESSMANTVYNGEIKKKELRKICAPGGQWIY